MMSQEVLSLEVPVLGGPAGIGPQGVVTLGACGFQLGDVILLRSFGRSLCDTGKKDGQNKKNLERRELGGICRHLFGGLPLVLEVPLSNVQGVSHIHLVILEAPQLVDGEPPTKFFARLAGLRAAALGPGAASSSSSCAFSVWMAGVLGGGGCVGRVGEGGV